MLLSFGWWPKEWAWLVLTFVRWGEKFQRESGIESLLLHNENSQLKWFGHLVRMSHRCLLEEEMFHDYPTNRRLCGVPTHHCCPPSSPKSQWTCWCLKTKQACAGAAAVFTDWKVSPASLAFLRETAQRNKSLHPADLLWYVPSVSSTALGHCTRDLVWLFQ